MTLLELEEVTASYGPVQVLDGVSLSVPDNGAVGILGANGAGKTTTLRGIVGLANRLAGTVHCDGAPLGIDSAEIVRRGLSYVPEGRHVFPYLSVEENLLVAAYSISAGRAVALRRRDDMFERFPLLANFRARPAGSLSGGQQQILAIARALMQQPRYLLIDEPSLGLSPVAIEQVASILSGLVQEGMGLLLVEQNVELCLGLCHRGYVLVSGEITASGSAQELKEMNVVQKLYFGDA
jgi:branched-chain amino acid transport system ATP-binding protein